jgi:hypothetical protein
VTSGAFDEVPVVSIKEAQAALLARLWKDYKDDMRQLNKGDKPSDDVLKTITDVTKKVAKGFEG